MNSKLFEKLMALHYSYACIDLLHKQYGYYHEGPVAVSVAKKAIKMKQFVRFEIFYAN